MSEPVTVIRDEKGEFGFKIGNVYFWLFPGDKECYVTRVLAVGRKYDDYEVKGVKITKNEYYKLLNYTILDLDKLVSYLNNLFS